MSDIESRFDALRELGFTEQQIVDMVHRELAGVAPSVVQDPTMEGKSAESSRGSSPPEQHVSPETAPSSDVPARVKRDPELQTRPHNRGGRRTPVDWSPSDLVLNVDSHVEHHEWYSGPHPHPALAREYEKLCPGFMERQLRMQEDELRVRWRALERRDARLDRGQRYALVAALSVMSCGAFIAWLGAPGTGASLIGGVVVALVSAFLYRQQTVRKQLAATDDDGEGKPS